MAKEYTEYNKENIADFQKWLTSQSKKNDDIYSVKINQEVSIDDILTNSTGQKIRLSPEQQKYIAKALCQSVPNKEWGKQMINNVSQYPTLLGEVYKSSGNYGRGVLFGQIVKEMENRDFVSNIPVFYAITESKQIVTGTFEGEVRKLSLDDQEKINEMFENKVENYSQTNVQAHFFREYISHFYNYENAPEEMRDYINQSASSIQDLEKMDEKFYTRKMISEILKHYKRIDKPETFKCQTSGKTQEEKNQQVLPKYYRNLKSALIRLSQTTEDGDSDCYSTGVLKPLTQRYKEKISKMLGKNNWENIPSQQKEGLLDDVYLHAAQKDILDGRGKFLGVEDLQKVVNTDEQHYYIRKLRAVLKEFPISKSISGKFEISIDKQKLTLTRDQVIILHLDDENTKTMDSVGISINDIALNPQITLSEKEAYIKTYYDKNFNSERYKAIEEQFKKYDQDKGQLEEQEKEVRKAELINTSIKQLQEKYKDIQKHIKTEQRNPQESYLEQQNMEKFLQDYMSGKITAIPVPEYKSLPLLFGRKEEDKRRQEMVSSIKNFNKALQEIKNNRACADIAEKFDGVFLSSESLDKFSQEFETNKQKYNEQETKVRQQDENISQIKQEKNHYDIILSQVNKYTQYINERKEELRKKAKEKIHPAEKDTKKKIPTKGPEGRN